MGSNDQGNSSEGTGIFEIPAELISQTKKQNSTIPIKKKEIGKKRYFLYFRSMEGTPSFEIKEKSTVGREVGEITISDPSLSSEHATFNVRDGVLFLTDHGSKNGTFVDGAKIKAGKDCLIEPSDKVILGNVPIEIRLEVPETYAKITENVSLIPESERPKEKGPSFFSRFFSKLKFKREKKTASAPSKFFSFIPKFTETIGMVGRFWALIADVCIVVVFFVIFGEEDTVRQITSDAHSSLIELFNQYALLHVQPLVKPDHLKLCLDYFEMLFPYFMVFYAFKIVGALLFGVSIAQFLMGIKSENSFLWARGGGILRTVLEMILSPLFFILDLPVVMSKRSFKEFITFTNLTPRNKILRFLGNFIICPMLILVCFLSPLLKDFKFIERGILVEEIMTKKKKKRVRGGEEITSSAAIKLVFNVDLPKLYSKIEYEYDPALLILPSFVKNKNILYPGLTIISKEQRVVGEFFLEKTFSMGKLLEIAEWGNPLFSVNYPELGRFLGASNKKNIKPLTTTQVTEWENLIKKTFELSVFSLDEHLMEYGPFVLGYVELRNTFLKMFGVEFLEKAEFLKVGKNTLLIIEGDQSSNSIVNYVIPLNSSMICLYKFLWRPVAKGRNVSLEFYKKYFEKHEFSSDQALEFPTIKEDSFIPSFLSEFLFANSLDKEKEQMLEQTFYNLFYSSGTEVLKIDDKLVSKEFTQLLSHFESNKKNFPFADLEVQTKFLKNVADLKNAIQEKNKAYFGNE